jgi:Zn-dependent protease with chaperone function
MYRLALGALLALTGSKDSASPVDPGLARVQSIGVLLEGANKYCEVYFLDGAEEVCQFQYRIVPNPLYGLSKNARAKDGAILVTRGAVNAFTDDELAWLIGHEQGHYALAMRGTEVESDLFGASIAQKAGFDPCSGIMALRKMKSGPNRRHPKTAVRVGEIQKAFPECRGR